MASLAQAQEAQTQDQSNDTATTSVESEKDQNSPQDQPQDTERKQEQKPSTLQTVVVTGIRHSIATSVETKNESSSIVEAISAEDIGKLPDVSIAESIARLPGLAAQRVNGRAQVIAIRGLAPDFAATLLNGREQVTTGDNRGVEFDQYPSELINAVTVYKTPDALLIGQGLSGTVDLQTVRPLAFGERKLVFNLRGEKNSFGALNDGSGEGLGSRFSASYIDQFANDTIGIALGFAHLDSPFQEKHYKAWWWGGSASWFPANGIPGKPEGAEMLMGAEVWARSSDQTRNGLMGVFEYKPNDSFHSILDVYYSRFNQKETMRGIMWPQDPWTGNGVTLTNPTIVHAGNVDVVTGGTVHNLEPVIRNDYNKRKDDLFSAGWRNTWNFADNWSAMADLSYSTTKRKQSNIETYAGMENVGADGTVTPTLDSATYSSPLGPQFAQFNFGLDYTNPDAVVLSDPAGWGHDGRIEAPRLKDTIKALRFQVRRDFEAGPFSGVDAGVNFSRREKEKTSTVYFANLRNGRTPVAVDGSLRVSPTELDFAGIPGVLSYNVNGALDRYYDITQQMSNDDFQKDFTVTEKVRTLYAKLDIDTDIGPVRLRGNVGVQLVHTDQSSVGFNVNDVNNLGTIEAGTSYNDVLPSLNLVSDFGNGWFVRFGAAKTLARGRIDDMRAAANASVSPTTKLWSGSGGNPYLEPWRARAADLSVEKYFGDASYVALALFYKNLDNYIRTNSVEYDFSGYTNPDPETVPISNIGSFSTPINDQGGYLRGAELSTALDFGMLAPVLDGFGAQFSASYTESNINPGTSESSNPALNRLPGLSRDVGNLTLYYEKHGFSARISERYRSEFRGEVYSLFFSRAYTTVLADRQTDLQLGYEFGEGSRLNGLSFLLQVNNLTNSPYRTVQDSEFAGGATQPLEYNEYGRQFLFGVNYKF
jgi:iron complex outermembrane receptor protein